MEIKKIVFKNNRTMDLSQDAVNILIAKIEEGEKGLVIFKDTKKNVITVINVNEIACIV